MFVAGHLASILAGNMLQFSNGFSAFWAPQGVGLVALLVAPYRWWLAILVWLTAADTIATYLMFDIFTLPDDSIKVGLAAYLIRRPFPEQNFRIDSLPGYARMLAICTACFAAVGLVSAPSRELWAGFWMGDLLGVTIIVPLFFLRHGDAKRAQLLESTLTVIICFVATRALFLPSDFGLLPVYNYPYLLLPLILWMSLRLPSRVVGAAVLVMGAQAVFYTGLGGGPILALPLSPNDQVLVLQTFLLVVTTSPMMISLSLSETRGIEGESNRLKLELKESEETYRLLFETSGLAIAVMKDRSVVQMNRRLLQLYQLVTEDDILALAPPQQDDGSDSKVKAQKMYSQAFTQPVHTHWVARTVNGTERDLELTLFHLPPGEEIVLTAIDVSNSTQLLRMLEAERRSLEVRVDLRSQELLQANALLNRAVRGKQEFVAHLSHELKTPLTALLAQSETLLEELFGPLTESQSTAVREMRDNGERLSRLILDLLDLHRLERGQLQVVPHSLSLNDLLEEVKRSLEPTLERRRVSIKQEGDTEITLITDRNLAIRVLSLLMGRASRQTPEGEQFGVRIAKWPEVQRLELTVWDLGPPLASKTVNSIKDPYAYRSEIENRSETGVSLAVAAGILSKLGGELNCRSGKDGTLLTATFPLEVEP